MAHVNQIEIVSWIETDDDYTVLNKENDYLACRLFKGNSLSVDKKSMICIYLEGNSE